jgi:hypothetical protein
MLGYSLKATLQWEISFILNHPKAALALEFDHCSIQSQVKLTSSTVMFVNLPDRFAYTSETHFMS